MNAVLFRSEWSFPFDFGANPTVLVVFCESDDGHLGLGYLDLEVRLFSPTMDIPKLRLMLGR